MVAANVGDERATAQQPERLAGIVERVHQDGRQRYIILRLNAPAPGIALIGTYGNGNGANASMTIYFYGEDADQYVAENEPKWREWFGETFKRA